LIAGKKHLGFTEVSLFFLGIFYGKQAAQTKRAELSTPERMKWVGIEALLAGIALLAISLMEIF